jgi:hypothetical protein
MDLKVKLKWWQTACLAQRMVDMFFPEISWPSWLGRLGSPCLPNNRTNCYTDGPVYTTPLRETPNMRSIFSTPVMALMLTLLSWGAVAQTPLITEAESQTPNLQVPTTRAITRGPGISLLSPTEVAGKSFGFKMSFEPRGGAKIDPASIKFEYLKQPVVDLTARFKTGLNGNHLELPQASVPAGTHPIRVSVRDSEGREGKTIIHLNAK